MVESGSAGGNGGTQAPARAGAPPRPALILPPRSSMASLFQGGGGLVGGAAEVSPGPMTLVSSFFAEDPDSDYRSFSQLLAGAMNSPMEAEKEGTTRRSAGVQEREGPGGGAASDAGGGGMARLGQNRPPSLAVSQRQLFTVPPGMSPTSLLDSPAFFSSGLGNFGMSHQEALAQITAQAALSPFRMPSPMEFPSPLFTAATATSSQEPTRELNSLQQKNTTFESADESRSNQISQPAAVIVDKPADDGYNWRKYGQKIVKGCEYPRSYYKCTHPNCPVKKKLERSEDGQVTEIIYKGQHNHPRPMPNRRSKEGDNTFGGLNEINGNHDISTTSETGTSHHGNLKITNHTASALFQRDRESGYGISEQLSGSSDNEDVAEVKTDEGGESEPDHKRRNISFSSQRTLTEPRIVVQTTSEVDLLDDGYRWRKYGQKVVKGNPNPRSYYKCTFAGCNVRKHIERSSTDPKAIITTYEGKHNHDVPAARNSSHNAVGAVLAPIPLRPNQSSLSHANFNRNDQRPVGVLQLKEEHEIT